jgi:hypothetical protein
MGIIAISNPIHTNTTPEHTLSFIIIFYDVSDLHSIIIW